MFKIEFVILVSVLSFVFVETLSFMVYMRRLAKRLRSTSKQLYSDMMPRGWLRASLGRQSVVHAYSVAERLKSSGDHVLVQEGKNLKTVNTVILIIDLLVLAFIFKTIL